METVTLLLLILLAILVSLVKLQSAVLDKYKHLKTNLPGPKGWPILGNALYLRDVKTSKDSYRVLVELSKSYDAPMFSLRFGPKSLVIMVKDAKYIESLLNHRAIAWKSYFYKDIRKATKNGVFTRNGEEWELLRKHLVNFTRPKNIYNFHEKIKSKVAQLAQEFESKCGKGLFPLMPLSKAWALEMFILAGFGYDDFYSKEELPHIIERVETVLDKAFVDMVSLNSYLGFKAFDEEESDKAFNAASRRIGKIFSNRTAAKPNLVRTVWSAQIVANVSYQGNMLKFIVKRKAELKEQGRDIQEVINNPENYIDACLQVGHMEGLSDDAVGYLLTDVLGGALDSPGSVIATMILFLAIFPEYQEKLYQEQMDYFGDPFRPPEEDELKHLPYLDMVMKEAIRFCSPPVVSRRVDEDIEIDGYHIPEGAVMVFSVTSSLNDPKHWEQPNTFYPEHFLPEAVAKREKGAYLPFVTGPKMCPGQLYSNQVVKTALSVVVRQFEFKTEHKYSDIEYKILLMREPVDPYVSVSKREIN